jgi:hypothetical protein
MATETIPRAPRRRADKQTTPGGRWPKAGVAVYGMAVGPVVLCSTLFAGSILGFVGVANPALTLAVQVLVFVSVSAIAGFVAEPVVWRFGRDWTVLRARARRIVR